MSQSFELPEQETPSEPLSRSELLKLRIEREVGEDYLERIEKEEERLHHAMVDDLIKSSLSGDDVLFRWREFSATLYGLTTNENLEIQRSIIHLIEGGNKEIKQYFESDAFNPHATAPLQYQPHKAKNSLLDSAALIEDSEVLTAKVMVIRKSHFDTWNGIEAQASAIGYSIMRDLVNNTTQASNRFAVWQEFIQKVEQLSRANDRSASHELYRVLGSIVHQAPYAHVHEAPTRLFASENATMNLSGGEEQPEDSSFVSEFVDALLKETEDMLQFAQWSEKERNRIQVAVTDVIACANQTLEGHSPIIDYKINEDGSEIVFSIKNLDGFRLGDLPHFRVRELDLSDKKKIEHGAELYGVDYLRTLCDKVEIKGANIPTEVILYASRKSSVD